MTRECQHTTFWPDWIMKVDPEISLALDSIATTHSKFLEKARDGYLYEHVSQTELNAVYDMGVEQNIISKEGKIIQHVQLPKDVMAMICYDCGAAYRLLGLFISTREMVLVQLIEAANSSLNTGSLVVALLCFRSVLEQVAHFNNAIDMIRIESAPDTYEKARPLLTEIKEKIVKITYPTRIDWVGLVMGESEDKINKNQIKYTPTEFKIDLTAKNILNAIDNLEKKIAGVRAVYEVLCEFAHPNFGLAIGLVRSGERKRDPHGFHWFKKDYSLEAPIAVSESLRPLLKQIFTNIATCLIHQVKLTEEARELRLKVQQISQLVLRGILFGRNDFLEPYALCPCGSNVKVKFCCGGRLH